MYLTKEDDRPFLLGVRISECSLFTRCWHHAKTVYPHPRAINKADSFIVGLGQHSRFAISIIERHIEQLREAKALQRQVLVPNQRCSVSREILNTLSSSTEHLYITGGPGNGKTEVVDWYLKGKKYWKGGEPSGFLFGTLTDNCDFIWFEDFDMFKYQGHLNTLLSLMDHKETTISKKCCDDRTIVSPARHIYISNYHIPADYPMFKRRVKIINVNHRLWECEGCYEYLNDPSLLQALEVPELAFGNETLEQLFDEM